jgi:hypothetical protein
VHAVPRAPLNKALELTVRHLNIQLQPDRAARLDLSRARGIIEALAQDHAIVAGFDAQEGEDEGRYLNFTFLAKDPATLWQRIRANVLAEAVIGHEIASSSIIVCEGDHGWDDYLLLHHYDPGLAKDDL